MSTAVNLAQNRKAAARKNRETVLAENPDYPGLRALLGEDPA